jgi:3-isopropylmalate/(R)-2-methylmalate dehydratase small subunit
MSAFEPITRITAVAAPLLRDNVDTDAIIPSREMKTTGKTGLAEGLFAGWRYSEPGGRTPRPDFVLNQPQFSGAKILLGGSNFGSGSSREHAVWALAEYGFRAVVAASFAPIFRGNCIRNGIVPAQIEKEDVVELAAAVAADPRGNLVTVDVARLCIGLPDGRRWNFALDSEAKAMLMEGLDAIDLTLKLGPEIAAFQAQDRVERPWVYLGEKA